MKNLSIKLLKKTRLIFWLTILILNSSLLPAQTIIDSLKNVLTKHPETDTNTINCCLDIAWEYMYSVSDSADHYARLAIAGSQKINNALLETNSYNTLGVTYIVRSNYSKALSVLDTSLVIAQRLLDNDPENKIYIRRILATLTNIGNAHYFQGEYSQAIDHYLKALHYSELIDFFPGQANSLSNISMAYKDLHDYDKALKYNYKAMNLARKAADNYWLSSSLNNIGTIYYAIPNYDSAKHYFLISMKLFQEAGNDFALIESNVNMGNIHKALNNYDTALTYYNKALQLSNKLSSSDGLINANYMMGQLYDTIGQFDRAVDHFKTSLALAKETGTRRFQMLNYSELSKVFAKKGDFEKAYNYFRKSAALHDSIFNSEHDKHIAELETKYQTREKEERIKLLTEQNNLEKAQARNRQIIFVSVIIILILLLFVIASLYRSYKHKQEAEKNLLLHKAEKKVLDAVIKTEFEERKRFAEDLHDAMGAVLSTLKLYINELGDAGISQEERQKMLKQSNSLLDEAIGNARSISHNIMPASLKDNGLVYSLQSFIDKINASGKIKIHLKTKGMRDSFKPVVSLSVYRMITEMINNTLKHAEASLIEISLIEENNKLYLHYKDNGKGFDFEQTLKNKGGIGLKNILNRIEVLGGTYTINSGEGQGFTAVIDFDL